MLGKVVQIINRRDLALENGNLVGRSLAGLPVSGADTGVDQPRPRVGLAPLEDGWPRPPGQPAEPPARAGVSEKSLTAIVRV